MANHEHISNTPRTGASILIVEDSEALRRGLRLLVEDMGLFSTIYEAADGFAAFKLQRQQPVDIVLCDLQMPRCDGFGMLRLQQSDPRTSQTPVLMLTAADDVATRVKVLGSGASDYVSKPAHAEELRARLSIHLRLKQLHDELRDRTAELDRIAHTDTLTGMPNRRHLDEMLAQEYSRSLRYRRPFSVLMIDLDHFKRLNDTYGHLAGDHALQAVARILGQQVRKPDVVARYGGEEFTVIMPETPIHHAASAAERIRREIEATPIFWEATRLPVTSSIGVAGYPALAAAAASELLEAADQGLYAAKQAGRNRVEVVHAGAVTAPLSSMSPTSALSAN